MASVNWIKKLGPGLLFAGAAIGVSHLVQSTKAGALFGWGLIWAVLLANLLKYPFFEFGPRYAASTGETLLEGYKKLGKWAITAILLLTITTMFTIQAAVTIVTEAIASRLFGWDLNPVLGSAILLGICMSILMVGKYNLLDKLIKYIIVLLAVSTLFAVAIAWANPVEKHTEFLTGFQWNEVGIAFLIGLMGWMPAPLDLSVWSSIWTNEKEKQLGQRISLKDSLFDFNVGYIGTVFLALGFVSLGALVVYGTGTEIPSKGGAFAGMIINMYTSSLGDWAYPVIIVAAFTTMFSTTLTCLDAFPRVLGRAALLFLKPDSDGISKSSEMPEKVLGMARKHFDAGNYWVWIILVAAGALGFLYFLGGEKMGMMVQIATILSFVTAPLFAFINYRLITSRHVPPEARPKLWLRILAILGILFLTGFSIFFVVVKFF